ncbi:MAG: Regulator of chromosome condensation (RCC1) repeat protein [Bacteroidetes bacterium ADurb.Bin217]|nr:MAG: Regulator of chromosome condensation (RCC1) repeat protein [Bacteroidetes bacterium ADurb.Bin217]
MKFFKFILILIVFATAYMQTKAQYLHFAGGYMFSVFVCNNQQIYTWGDNYYEQLARTNTTCSYKIPCIASIPYSVVSVDAGFGGFCAAVTNNNQVITWGSNYYGELGSGENCTPLCSRISADRVLGGETGNTFLEMVQTVSIGQSHAYALLNTGEVVAWGSNAYGQLGDGTTNNRNTPVFVKISNTERLQNIVMISAGGNHGYALTADGYVYAWGNNQNNQLACGNSNSQSYAKLVIDKNNNPVTGITAIDGGRNFGLLLRNSSMVMGLGAYKGSDWGPKGKIYTTYTYAELVSGGQTPNYYLENVVAISAGYNHSLAIVKEQNQTYVVAWGDNLFDDLTDDTGGQIGTGTLTTQQYYIPHYVLRLANTKISGAVSVVAGCGVSYIQTYNAQTNANEFWVCGSNEKGQLGTNDLYDRLYATRIDQGLCNPYCAQTSLGNNKSYCIPFNEAIRTNLSPTQYSFAWYKNGNILPEIADSLVVSSIGTYKVRISYNSHECPEYYSEIEISEQEKNYIPIISSYCDNNIQFKVIGEGTYSWYNGKYGYQLGSGNSLTVSRFFTEEILPDSLYRVWIESENNCQRMPLQSIKKCNCSTPPPTATDTSSCYNRNYFVFALGDSVIWHSDPTLQSPLAMQNILELENLGIGTHTLYATQVINRCESSATAVDLLLYYCDPWFTVSGTVLANNERVAETKVLLVDSESSTALDSCTTNHLGQFTLYSHNNTANILARAHNEHYLNTWAGNKTLQQLAYDFIIDAHITGVQIHLQPISSDITVPIKPEHLWEHADEILVYNMHGQLLEKAVELSNINDLQIPQGLYILILYANKQKLAHILWNK